MRGEGQSLCEHLCGVGAVLPCSWACSASTCERRGRARVRARVRAGVRVRVRGRGRVRGQG